MQRRRVGTGIRVVHRRTFLDQGLQPLGIAILGGGEKPFAGVYKAIDPAPNLRLYLRNDGASSMSVENSIPAPKGNGTMLRELPQIGLRSFTALGPAIVRATTIWGSDGK